MSGTPLSACPGCGATVEPRPAGVEVRKMVHEAGCWLVEGRECDWCGGPMLGKDPEAEVCSDRCRAARWKWRNNYGRVASVRPPRTQSHRSRASGLQVSYRRAVAAVAEFLRTYEPSRLVTPEEQAERVLAKVLSDRQYEQLRERRGWS